MFPSIFLTVFERPTVTGSLDAARAAGFTGVHFDLSLLGGQILPDQVNGDDLRRVRGEVEARSMTVVSVEATYNMSHRDPSVRRRGRDSLSALIENCEALGASVLSLCTGSRSDNMWVRHADNATTGAWADMVAEVAAAAERAERHSVILGIECEYSNVVSSAKLGRRLLDELGSPAVKIVLDGANLIPPGEHAQQDSILKDAFELLGDDIVVAHAKDILPDGTFVAAGRGVLDYGLFVALLREHEFDGPLILHSLSEVDVSSALALLRSVGVDLTPPP